MKKTITTFLALFVLTLSTVNAQQSYNQWSLGLNVGGHYGASPATYGYKTIAIGHYAVNGRYMMNNRVGVQLDAGLDKFKAKTNLGDYKSDYFRTSFQLVANAGDVFRFDTWTKHIGLLVHGGFGGSILMNDKDTRSTFNIGKRRDLMLNAIVGVTPQFKINERVSLNIDLSYITNIKQSWDYTMLNSPNPVAFKNQLINWSVGATFNIGKNSTHADWTSTVHGTSKAALNAQDKRIQELENKIQKD
ncbi:MAG: outer membrane beta-barrel protein [Crocinitomicaceae bacterium]|nr:outer membrane beta-barrel protein [Crocinitomicaceae bacterium]